MVNSLIHILSQQFDNQQEQNEQNSAQDLDFKVEIKESNQEKKQSDIENFQKKNLQEAQQIQQPPIAAQALEPPKAQNTRCLIVFFHLLFKLLAILFFFFLNMLVDNQVLSFVIIIIIDAFDFWTVKNVTGRKLVGLRWWSEIKDDGTEVWLYESMEANFIPNEFNANMFWLLQGLATLTWIIMFIIDLISFQWFWCILAFIGIILTGLNLVGFYKCRGEHQKKAKDYMAKLGLKAIQKVM